MVDLGTLAYLTQWLEKHYCCCCSKGLMVSYSCRNSASGLGIVQRAGIPCRPGPTFGCCRHSSAILRLRAGLGDGGGEARCRNGSFLLCVSATDIGPGLEVMAEGRTTGRGFAFLRLSLLTSGLVWRRWRRGALLDWDQGLCFSLHFWIEHFFGPGPDAMA